MPHASPPPSEKQPPPISAEVQLTLSDGVRRLLARQAPTPQTLFFVGLPVHRRQLRQVCGRAPEAHVELFAVASKETLPAWGASLGARLLSSRRKPGGRVAAWLALRALGREERRQARQRHRARMYEASLDSSLSFSGLRR